MNEEKVKTLRAAYYRDWRKKNPDKVRENNARYWRRRAEKLEKAEIPKKEVQDGTASGSNEQ